MNISFKSAHCMCPIYGPHLERDRPNLIGTGLLIDLVKARFLITAAHVVDWFVNNQAQMYIVGMKENRSTLLEVNNGFRRTPLPAAGDRNEDKFDFAFLRLQDELADNVAKVRPFLPLTLIDMSDKLNPNDRYMFAGYPCNREKTDYGKRLVQPNGWALADSAAGTAVMHKLGFHSQYHIAMKYSRARVRNDVGNLHAFPRATGMSGGPVWKGNGPVSEWLKSTPVRLIGMGIEAREIERVLIGVRIHIIIDSIAKENPDIASIIPKRANN